MARFRVFAVALLLTACGGGGGGGDDPPAPPAPTTFTVSGRVTVPQGVLVDSDVNNPNAEYTANDTQSTAQVLPNPIMLGGFANVPGAGATGGRSTASGDRIDYFRTSAVLGQRISLNVSDADSADLDLFLLDSTGRAVASSVGNQTLEQVSVPSAGTYLIRVEAIRGASNYVLTIGGAAQASAGMLSTDADFVPGEAIVKLKDGEGTNAAALSERFTALSASHGFARKAGTVQREMLVSLQSPAVAGYRSKAFAGTAAGDQISEFASAGLREKWETLMAIKALQRDPNVQYAEPNYILQPAAVPNDEFYSLQWHYRAINLSTANDVTSGSSSVVVAVVDTGVLLNHPDLQGQLVGGYDFIQNAANARDGNSIDNNPDDPGNEPQRAFFHGTHVAGTIAAATNNQRGVAGVAPLVKIMPVRVLGVGGGANYDILQGVRFAAGLPNDSGTVPAKRADIINMSLGRQGGGISQPELDLYTQVRQLGIFVVASAMNNNVSDPAYPAAYGPVISVSATSYSKTRASYSNFGTTVDVAAPGGDSGDIDGDGYQDLVLSLCGDNSSGTSIAMTYCFAQGTSMAAPHISGVIALMKSVSSSLTPDQFDQYLTTGRLTEDIGASGRDNDFGWGLIDARKAVLAAQGGPPPQTPALQVTPAALNFSIADTTLDLALSNPGGGTLQITAVTPSVPWITATRSSGDAPGPGRYTVRVDRTGKADGTYSAQIQVTSNGGTLTIPVLVQVFSGSAAMPNAGRHYIVLYDPAKPDADPVKQVVLNASSGGYTFQLTDVPPGTYELTAGSDADNDLFICDEGEACGTYLTTDQPKAITVDRNVSGLNFVSTFEVSIGSGQAAQAGEAASKRRAVRRVQ